MLNFAFEPKEIEVLADDEEPVNEILNFEESDLNGDWPEASSIVMDNDNGKKMEDMIREAIAGQTNLIDTTSQNPNSEIPPSNPSVAPNTLPGDDATNMEMMDTSDVDAAVLSDPPGNPDVDILETASDNQVKVDFPEMSKAPVSEFVPGYYSMSFPELFPSGDPEHNTVSREQQTKYHPLIFSLPVPSHLAIHFMFQTRPGRQPSFEAWCNHLMQLKDRRYVEDPVFMMLIQNQMQRR